MRVTLVDSVRLLRVGGVSILGHAAACQDRQCFEGTMRPGTLGRVGKGLLRLH